MLSARKRVVALALCVVAAGAVGGVIAAQSDGGGATASASDDGKADVVDSPDESLQACADSWNDGNANKESVASISTAAQAENPTAYVHVGFSSVFPDKCMITVANPSTMYAQQYLQGAEANGLWPPPGPGRSTTSTARPSRGTRAWPRTARSSSCDRGPDRPHLKSDRGLLSTSQGRGSR
ncbi:hypothetical protein SAV14893_050440 [Streptomyces avermitilis]|uniref:Secreted protein n=1 Tax=Streptomyces avermitilis TaxID=33903 RepID=A0A4D4LVM3_STRAX|nr:hypothetical protein SAV14893_050440 [Streptomyces avermitilis]